MHALTHHTSQICNDSGRIWAINWYQAGRAAQDLLDNCCRNSRGRPENHHALSGMLRFTQYPQVNAIVAYANCQAPEDTRPGDYKGWQANGRCW